MRGLAKVLHKKLWGITFITRVSLLLLNRRYHAAEALCRKGIAMSPISAVYHDWLGRALWRQGRLEEAIEEYRTAIGLQRATFSAQRIELINILLEAKRYEEVIAESQKLLDPQFHRLSLLTSGLHQYTAFSNMAQAYAALGDYHRAKEAWTELLKFHKKGKGKAQVLSNIAVCDAHLNHGLPPFQWTPKAV